jgi:hypothetical protein
MNKVQILGALDYSWIDTLLDNNIVHRVINKSEIYFIDGQIILRKKSLPAKPFTKAKVDSKNVSSFVTLDIETIKKQNGKLVPYLISAYNGSEYINSYAQVVNGVIDQKQLFDSFIHQLITLFPTKSKSLIVYAHNLSGFDGIFLLNHLLPFGKVEPIIYNSKLIAIKVRLINGKTVTFKDSYLLLPSSIRKLCKAFKIEESKGLFPFSLRNIFYKGIFPAYKYWTGITLEQYLDMKMEWKGKTWSFKDEAIKYCNLDCKCLFEILVKFNDLIYNQFSVSIHNSLTLPSLSMRIYKSKFMPQNTIYQLTPNIDRDIRQSYTGGAVDVYKPHNRISSWLINYNIEYEKLFYYDVNSLYPFIMANTPMPVGTPKAFKGDIRAINPDAFGFFYCEITSPSDIAHPVLQQRIKTVGGIRTIAGTGSWTGWIFSSELDNAANHKYQFKIIKGYEFEKGYIFKDYIETLYALRMQYDKDDPMNYVAKLLMNSLYGKFGMKTQSTKVDIYNILDEAELKVFNEMVDTEGPAIQDWLQIDNHFIVIRDNIPNPYHNEDNDHYHGLDVNVSIAAAITAGGRMWMSTLKNNPDITLFYSDTDSAITNKPLKSFLVGSNLGQFKLECVITRAVFLAPKVYAFITDDGQEIIKVKGIKQDALSGLHIEDLENLLQKDSTKEFTQDKWFKSLTTGTISVKDVAYNLKATSNKRESIYENDIFEATMPFNYNHFDNK